MRPDNSAFILQNLFDQIDAAMFIIDSLSGDVIDLNKSALALIGRSRADAVNVKLERLFPDEQQQAITDLLRRAPKAQGGADAVLTVRQKEGPEIQALSHAFAFQVAADEFLCVLLISIEVSTSTGEPSFQEGLLARIKQQAKEIEALRSKVLQLEKMAALGDLVAGVAHEINTPLGALRSNTDTILRLVKKIRELVSESQVSEREKILSLFDCLKEPSQVSGTAVDRIVWIVDSLRGYARADAADMEEADIHQGIESALTLTHHEYKDRVAVVRDFASLPPITCHPNQLSQAFLNILVNASHAMGDKGEMRITTRRVNSEHVSIAFSDNGTGIEPDLIHKVFKPGFTTKKAGHGTGLGLSIVQQIVETHRGRIDMASEVGKGTTITIVLPIKPAK